MDFNSNGTVNALSVREVKRVFLKSKENQTIKYRLATVRRGRVRVGEIAVLDDREFMRVSSVNFQGAAWIEIL